MQKIEVNKNIIQDAINIFNRVYHPLIGFLNKKDFLSVLENMRLADGKVWSIPVVLDINEDDYIRIKNNKKIILINSDLNTEVILDDIEIYDYNKKEFAKKVYGTLDNNHPGVVEVMKMKKYLVGGKVVNIKNNYKIFAEYNFTPVKTKEIFKKNNWKTITAFQTRNIPHRGHEFLQKYALQNTDGLFIQPVIGEKKLEDFKDEYIISSYKLLIDKYHPKDKVLLGILPLKMRYAGPREAIVHALIRKNFGCTHFIIGRDHAGVGNYYHSTEAQDIFDKFKTEDIGIKILKYQEVVYDKLKKKHCFINECEKNNAISFSGTILRESIKNKEQPPAYLVRSDIYDILVNSNNSLVDDMYKNNKKQKGFVLWFTGLSAAGKSTIADEVYKILKQKNIKLERLDGDIVRENLTKDLGFSCKDRDENIRRVGFVSDLLSRNGVGVIASFISPYNRQRKELKKIVHNFIEVFVDTPLSICEDRDPKGMYKKARAGKIKMFTGVSDVYEKPNNPDIILKTNKITAKECAKIVIDYLIKNNFI